MRGSWGACPVSWEEVLCLLRTDDRYTMQSVMEMSQLGHRKSMLLATAWYIWRMFSCPNVFFLSAIRAASLSSLLRRKYLYGQKTQAQKFPGKNYRCLFSKPLYNIGKDLRKRKEKRNFMGRTEMNENSRRWAGFSLLWIMGRNRSGSEHQTLKWRRWSTWRGGAVGVLGRCISQPSHGCLASRCAIGTGDGTSPECTP